MGNNFEGPLRQRIKSEAVIILASSAVIFGLAAIDHRGHRAVDQLSEVQDLSAK